LLSTSDRVDVAELLEPRRRPPPPPAPATAFELPDRQVSGFVQLAVRVDNEGRVESAEVLNAVPAGVFEDEALRIVRQRRYAVPPDGRAVDDIVRFTVPADGVAQEEATSGLSE
jgi:TonB family protein